MSACYTEESAGFFPKKRGKNERFAQYFNAPNLQYASHGPGNKARVANWRNHMFERSVNKAVVAAMAALVAAPYAFCLAQIAGLI